MGQLTGGKGLSFQESDNTILHFKTLFYSKLNSY